MDQAFMDRLRRLEALALEDDIFGAYHDSVQELQDRFEQIARDLPEADRDVLYGYGDCLRLMQLRLKTLVCEKMDFVE